MKSRNLVVALTISILLAGCAAQVVSYHPASTMSVKDASAALVDLAKKNNDSVEINKDFITLDNSDRIYFSTIEKVAIYATSDAATMLKSYAVYVDNTDKGKYVYRTIFLKDAEQYVDALESIIFAYKSNHKELTKPSETATSSNADKLIELQSLKNKGLITDDEYQAKKKQILERM